MFSNGIHIKLLYDRDIPRDSRRFSAQLHSTLTRDYVYVRFDMTHIFGRCLPPPPTPRPRPPPNISIQSNILIKAHQARADESL